MATRAEIARARRERANQIRSIDALPDQIMRDGSFEEVPSVSMLESAGSGLMQRGEDFANAFARIGASEEELQRINTRAFENYVQRSEARIQNPNSYGAANVAPDVLATLASPATAFGRQAAVQALSGFTQPAQNVGEQVGGGLKQALLNEGLARTGNIATSVLGGKRVPITAGGRSQEQVDLLNNMRQQGIVLSPAEATGSTGLKGLETALETQIAAIPQANARRAANQEVANNVARKALGLPEQPGAAAALTIEDIVRAQENSGAGMMNAARQMGPISPDAQTLAEIKRLWAREEGTVSIARPGQNVAEEADALGDLLTTTGVEASELVTQRIDLLERIASDDKLTKASRQTLTEMVGLIDDTLETTARRIGEPQLLDDVTRYREQSQVAALLSGTRAGLEEGAGINPFSREIYGKMNSAFAVRPGMGSKVNNQETQDLYSLIRGFNLPGMKPFRSSGTAERTGLMNTVTAGMTAAAGGASSQGSITGEPVLDALLTLGIAPGIAGALMNSQRMSGALLPVNPSIRRGAGLLTPMLNSGEQQEPQ